MAFILKGGGVESSQANEEKIDYSQWNVPTVNGYPDEDSQRYFLTEIASRINTLIQSGDSVIDYGCGTGEFSNYLASDVQYYGIDSTPFKINMAKATNDAAHRTFATRFWSNTAFGTEVDPDTKSTWGININGLSAASEIEANPVDDLELCLETMLRCSEKGIILLASLSDRPNTYIDEGEKIRYSGSNIITAAHNVYYKLYNNTSFEHLSYEVINDGEVFILFIQKTK